MITIWGPRGEDADHRFAEPSWDERTRRWQDIDRCMPADRLARQIAQAVEKSDLAALFAGYSGRGSNPSAYQPHNPYLHLDARIAIMVSFVMRITATLSAILTVASFHALFPSWM